MEILVVSSVLPWPSIGGRIRFYNLYSRLAARHRITWICSTGERYRFEAKEAEQFLSRILSLPAEPDYYLPSYFLPRLFSRALNRLKLRRLRDLLFDRVQSPAIRHFRPSQARLDLIAQVLDSGRYDVAIWEEESLAELVPGNIAIPKVITLLNLPSVVFKRQCQNVPSSWKDRLFFGPEFCKVVHYEKNHFSRFDLAVTMSAVDQDVLRSRCPRLESVVIPNGVDVDCFHPNYQTVVSAEQLLFIGTYSYYPNLDAMHFFCQKILPFIRQKHPNVRLSLVGHDPPPELNQYAAQGVEVIGAVPDTRPYLEQANVFVVPLRVGGGTRLKILEAMAMGKPVVSTSIGAEGLQVTPGHDILIADDPVEFASAVVKLLECPELRTDLAQNGRALVERLYDWNSIALKFEDVLVEIAGRQSLRRGFKPTKGLTLCQR